LTVFELGDVWVIVCELSIRQFVDNQEVDRMEFGEVVTDWHYSDGRLKIVFFDNAWLNVRILERRLVAERGIARDGSTRQ